MDGGCVCVCVCVCEGFVYMSEFLHAQLAFSQYIAPLMADLSLIHI